MAPPSSSCSQRSASTAPTSPRSSSSLSGTGSSTGAPTSASPTRIDDAVEATIERLIPLAPLHNPANLEGIRVARARFPDVPQVAVFDTAFHQTLPPHAYTYAVKRDWREGHRVRRYGFHGTSHSYVSRRAAELLGLAVEDANVIVLHLGNGASATAVAGGRSVDTSMGLSPLEGLVMGTRPGDLDPVPPGAPVPGRHLPRGVRPRPQQGERRQGPGRDQRLP